MKSLERAKSDSESLCKKSSEGLERPYNSKNIPALIISGGETGADMGALIAANSLNIPTIGFTTHNYKSENISKKWLKYYGLYPLPEYIPSIRKNKRTEGFSFRDQLNVDLCDGVFAIRTNIIGKGKGTFQTYNYANLEEYWPSSMDPEVQNKFWKKSKKIMNINKEGYCLQTIKQYSKIKNSKPIFILWLDPIIFKYVSISKISKELHNFIQKFEVHRLLISGPKEDSYYKGSNGKSIQNLVISILRKTIKKHK
jgi:hypothetical protein